MPGHAAYVLHVLAGFGDILWIVFCRNTGIIWQILFYRFLHKLSEL